MSSPGAQALLPSQRRPRVRKSIAHVPSSDHDQENAGQKNLTTDLTQSLKSSQGSKKSRSKSLGPGGLDALKETSGNRRRSVASSIQPKSILKPTIPLSPIRAIPTRRSLIEQSQTDNSASPSKQAKTAATAESVPDTPAKGSRDPQTKPTSHDFAQNEPSEDADAAERRKKKAEIQKHREARRKSMAGRRVSFAPEATLHTWDTEVLQDSTTSTGSAEWTRRASSFAKSQGSEEDRPGTPPEQIEQDATPRTPEHQRDAHKKRRRRSSGILPMNFNDPDALSSSPFSASSAAGDDAGSPSPNEAADGTLGDATMESISGANDDEDLDASLEDAAKRAGTRTLDLDENGDVSMDIAGDEVTAAFKPWVKQSMGTGSPHPGKAVSRIDQENINIFTAEEAAERGSPTPSQGGDDDMSMDMTQAMGGIIGNSGTSGPQPGERYPKRRKSVARRRRSSGDDSDLGDGTMDLTTAVGGVQQASSLADLDPGLVDENEELSMEFTSVFGGVKKGVSPSKKSDPSPGKSLSTQPTGKTSQAFDAASDEEDDGDMEMTEAIGSIQPQRPEESAPKDDQPEVQAASSCLRSKSAPRPRPSIGASATGSPARDPFARRDRLRRSGNGAAVSTPEKKPSTPPKQVTPLVTSAKPTTPSKTPPSASVAMRNTSPKRLFQEEIKAGKSPKASTPSLFRHEDGQQTPNIVLAPKSAGSRRQSLLESAEQAGSTSPKMAAILNRRTSISDNADVFAPEGARPGVKFEDPRAMDAEVSRERDEDRRLESGQFIMEQEADGEANEENATQNLKDLMQSMTPKKKPMKGRKSLATGSARGLLGKRPAELDDEEEETSPHTFGKPASPVKKIRLQAPPSAEETMRSSRNKAVPMSDVSGNARPRTPNTASLPDTGVATTPKSQGRFKDAETLPSAQKPVPTMGQTSPSDAESSVKDGSTAHLGLQDFLNLTNVRFMELNTTKRRPTAAPATLNENAPDEDETASKKFEESVVAGACTIPMLELFQHSCRELKKYISEGRNVVKEIEAETLEENPPIFKEYTTASPATRSKLDNQFKNMKTSARLLSKATWYEWRMKLLEGLQESLKDTTEGLQHDDEALAQQLQVIETALEQSQEKRSALEREHQILKQRADEMAGCDPEDLDTARQRLQSVTQDIESQSHDLEAQLESVSDLDQQLAAMREAKSTAKAASKEAQRQREECRGMSAVEVGKIQERVDHLAESSGWRIIMASGSHLTLELERQLSLSFDVSTYLPAATAAQSSASPSLTLVHAPSVSSGKANQEPTTTQRFFLQFMRAHLHSLAPSETHASTLLRVVSSGWQLACQAEDQVKDLRRRIGITTERIAGDEEMFAETSILLPSSQSKINIVYTLALGAQGDEIEAGVGAATYVAYGQDIKKSDMDKVVQKKVRKAMESGENGSGDWADAAETLKRLLERQ